MDKSYKKTLFIFRRDLRLEDNTGLIFALKQSKTVIPAFIFTTEQIEKNPYRSDHCLKFMIESLEDLARELTDKGGRLYLFKGAHEEILEQCISKLDIDALIVNRDYTPYSIKRDNTLEKICKTHHIAFHSFDDALLHPPEDSLKKDGTPYSVFTPYFRNISKENVPAPVHNLESNYFIKSIPFAKSKTLLSEISPAKRETTLKGGRSEGLKILKNLKKNYQLEGISHISPYLKFTVCSPREVYKAISHNLHSDHPLIRSLYWRDFFTTIAFFFPHVFKGSFRPKFDKLNWSDNRSHFNAWCRGETGFPIVDAGMREMNETGFMHNRARMIVGSFLVKDLHINWRWGEKYFAKNLIDYDPAVNNGNWQWVASTGCDAQPYFRIFNPWNQQKKFDPECSYIKKWVPELQDLLPKVIHGWDQEKYHSMCPIYPVPMIDHATEAKKSLAAYKIATI